MKGSEDGRGDWSAGGPEELNGNQILLPEGRPQDMSASPQEVPAEINAVFVKNLAPDTTVTWLHTLFAPFGNLRCIRMKTKESGGTAKGSAKVIFRTDEEA